MANLRKAATTYALAVVGTLAVVAAGLFAFSNRPIDVRVASIERDVPIRVFGLGTTEARVLSKIGFEVGATLTELHADHGDRVAKGQVLARLATGEQEAKVAKARAALLIADVNIAKGAANLEKARAVFVQRQEANRRKQALAGRDVVAAGGGGGDARLGGGQGRRRAGRERGGRRQGATGRCPRPA